MREGHRGIYVCTFQWKYMYADALIIMHSLSRHTVDDMYTKNKSKRKERKLLSDLRGGEFTHIKPPDK